MSNLELSTSGLVVAQATADQMKKAVEIYQGLVKELITSDDTVKIGDKQYIKKSGLQKLAVPFNLSTEVINESKEDIGDGEFAYHVKVRASSSHGRFVEKLGSCDTIEKPKASYHIVRTMAETRATSRALSALMGIADQPAEDMQAAQEYEKKREGMPKNNETRPEVCHCDFSEMKNDKGVCGNCKKPLTKAQIDALEKIKK